MLPVGYCGAADLRLRQGQAACDAEHGVTFERGEQGLPECCIAMRHFDEELGLAFATQRFQLADAQGAGGGINRQVADESKILAAQAAGGQRHQQRARPRKRLHGHAQRMRGAHHRAARVGHGGYAGFAHQGDVYALRCAQRGFEQRLGIKHAAMIAFFVHLARQLSDRVLLQRQCENLHLTHALDEGTAALGILTNPMRGLRGGLQRGERQHIRDRRCFVATEIQRGGDEEEFGGFQFDDEEIFERERRESYAKKIAPQYLNGIMLRVCEGMPSWLRLWVFFAFGG